MKGNKEIYFKLSDIENEIIMVMGHLEDMEYFKRNMEKRLELF